MNIVPPDDEPQDGQPWADQRVTAYVLGELDTTQRERFEQESLRDPALAAAVTEARGITDQLKTWFADEPPMTLDASRRESLLHAIMHAHGCAGSAPLSGSGPLTARPGRSHSLTPCGGWHWQPHCCWSLESWGISSAVGMVEVRSKWLWRRRRPAAPRRSRRRRNHRRRNRRRRTSATGDSASSELRQGSPQDARESVGDNRRSVPKESAEAQTLGLRVPDERPSVSRFHDQSPDAPAELYSRSRPDRFAAEPRLPSAPPVAEQQPLAAPSSDAMALGTLRAEADVRLGERRSLGDSGDGEIAARSSGDGGLGDITPAQQPLPLEEALLEDEQSGPTVVDDLLDAFDENPFQRVDEYPRSTFPIDVDTAAYAKVRDDLIQAGRMPRRDEVRIEELVNHFAYDYAGPPTDGPHPLAADIEIAQCPWNTKHRLVRIGIQTRRLAAGDHTPPEARRVLVERATPALTTIARDVQVQVEFSSAQVAAYRLIGYENRVLAQDGGNGTQSGGEVAAGHSVTALYELVPRAADADGLPLVLDQRKERRTAVAAGFADSDEVLRVKLRYTPVEQSGEATAGGPSSGDAESNLVEFATNDSGATFSQASEDFRFAALVAAFGLQLRASEHRGAWTLSDVLREATAIDVNQDETRAQWVELVRRAAELQTGEASR
jgi:hypothetical protein